MATKGVATGFESSAFASSGLVAGLGYYCVNISIDYFSDKEHKEIILFDIIFLQCLRIVLKLFTISNKFLTICRCL
jgi:hypothetical protein